MPLKPIAEAPNLVGSGGQPSERPHGGGEGVS